ncbi:MAG: hypothetical protein N2544_08530 [Burkholderiales bacterium]|nr:hypothetical protein [Burkholderiales bacterium]
MTERLIELVRLPRRAVHVLADSAPAVFLLLDERAGGILVNTPAFCEARLAAVAAVVRPSFIFYPSARGARDVERWRAATGARTIASAEETPAIAGTIDESVTGDVRLYGRLDFLMLSGRTRGTCALRVKEPPGLVFFGPAFEHAAPQMLRPHRDDYSYENRLIGALGIRDLAFEYAFCDDYVHGSSRIGPGAGKLFSDGLAAALDA